MATERFSFPLPPFTFNMNNMISSRALVTWQKYCQYGVKLNQSNNIEKLVDHIIERYLFKGKTYDIITFNI